MTPLHRIPIVLGLLAAAPISSTVAAPRALVQEAKPERYVKSTASTKLYNVADKQGVVVGEAPAGTLLAVYGERAGWLSVEPPQGLTVWVYGEFLRATSQPGIAEVTGDGVRLRPKPASTVDSLPLEQQLHEGDRVRVIGRNSASKALQEDWVKIVSPPGVRAWVLASETAAVANDADVRSAWMDAVKKGSGIALVDVRDGSSVAAGAPAAASANDASKAPSGAAATPAAAGAAKQDAAPAQGSWDAAERAYETAKSSPSPDWKPVRANFERYLAANPNGASAGTAKLRLEQIGYHEEIARIKGDAALQETQRQKMLADAQAQLVEASLANDPLWGRFQARGWLRRDETTPGRYLVQWAGRTGAEITCGSGRYDLTLFEGAEIGVIGALTRAAGSVDRPMRIDATRIEVLSAPTGR